MGLELPQTMSTIDVPPALRLRRWNDFASETFASMVVDPLDDRNSFSGQITRKVVDGLGFAWMLTSPSTAHSFGGVGTWPISRGDNFLLVIQNYGQSRIRRGGREVFLAPGDFVVVDLNRPGVTQAATSIGMTLIKLPFERLVTKIPEPDAIGGVKLDTRHGRVSFASSLLMSIGRTLENDPDGDWGEAISDLVLDALGMAFGRFAPSGTPHRFQRVGRREAFAYIERHLADPELTVGGIAKGLGVTTRYLQRIFLQSGISPRQHLLNRRLELAAHRLRRSADAGAGRITDIAFETGFNDASYFARAFTRKFGVSPREYRRTRV